MTELSREECAAGISRKALEHATRAANGRGKPPRGVTEVEKPEGRIPERTHVLDTWCHSLDILNLNGHNFVVRDTQHISDRADVTTIYLSRTELEKLELKIKEVLAA